MPDIDAQIAAAEQALKQSRQALDDRTRRQKADDRSLIAKLIVWVFVLLVAAVVLAVIWRFSDWEKIAEPAKFLSSILSSVLLPVVTLVIGYYFGKEK